MPSPSLGFINRLIDILIDNDSKGSILRIKSLTLHQQLDLTLARMGGLHLMFADLKL